MSVWATGSEAEFYSALVLLEGLEGSFDLEPCIDVERRAIDWPLVIEKVRFGSEGEIVLLEAALAMWTGREDAGRDERTRAGLLTRAMRILDEPNWARFLQALELKRPRRA